MRLYWAELGFWEFSTSARPASQTVSPPHVLVHLFCLNIIMTLNMQPPDHPSVLSYWETRFGRICPTLYRNNWCNCPAKEPSPCKIAIVDNLSPSKVLLIIPLLSYVGKETIYRMFIGLKNSSHWSFNKTMTSIYYRRDKKYEVLKDILGKLSKKNYLDSETVPL